MKKILPFLPFLSPSVCLLDSLFDFKEDKDFGESLKRSPLKFSRDISFFMLMFIF